MTKTVLITGPTRGLGRAATLAAAQRPGIKLLLVGRALSEVAAEARARGATVYEIPCDLASLADVRAAAAEARAHGPIDALIANAGAMSTDTRRASADGFEMTFAVNYLAHAQLIGDLLDVVDGRIVLLGSNTYSANFWRRLLGVPEADWRDPLEMARPASGAQSPGMKASGVAYSNAKLAILYYAHELQRHTGARVSVFEPGWMPGTALGRGAPAPLQAIARGLGRLPGVSKPEVSGPALASVALDDKWAHLRDGAFVVKDRVREVRPVARDRAREKRLWEATAEVLDGASRQGGQNRTSGDRDARPR